MKADTRANLRRLAELTRVWPADLRVWSDEDLMSGCAVALRIHHESVLTQHTLNVAGALTIANELLVEIARRGLLARDRGAVWHWFHDYLHAYRRAGELS